MTFYCFTTKVEKQRGDTEEAKDLDLEEINQLLKT